MIKRLKKLNLLSAQDAIPQATPEEVPNGLVLRYAEQMQRFLQAKRDLAAAVAPLKEALREAFLNFRVANPNSPVCSIRAVATASPVAKPDEVLYTMKNTLRDLAEASASALLEGVVGDKKLLLVERPKLGIDIAPFLKEDASFDEDAWIRFQRGVDAVAKELGISNPVKVKSVEVVPTPVYYAQRFTLPVNIHDLHEVIELTETIKGNFEDVEGDASGNQD